MNTMRMGSETEFGIVGGWSLGRAESIQNAIERHPHLSSVREGVYLANGGRAYIDQGLHNEYATPEVATPEALVVHELAGRRLMQEAAEAAGHTLLCANVSPANAATWGTHENYECSAELSPPALAHLFTHLATRVVYTGAGGLDPSSPKPRPVFSPRACCIRADLCFQGTQRKSLVFVKPHHYGSGYRLHVFCGESLLSHRASYLKYATTALVARCVDAGRLVGPGPLRAPAVLGLRKVNRDFDIARTLTLHDGRRMTALQIQWSIYESIMDCCGVLPDWAPRALRRWEAVLNALERGDEEITDYLDWALYLRAFEQLDPAPEATDRRLAEAQALYLRMHILGKDSLFESWAKAGHLNHELPEITPEAISSAMHTPPPGRASNRSRLIARFAGTPSIRLEWDRLKFPGVQETVPIPDEAAPEGWEDDLVPPPPAPPAPTIPSAPRAPVQAHFEGHKIDKLFRQGAYHALVSSISEADLLWTGERIREHQRTYALSLARLGRDTEADRILTSLRHSVHPFDHLADRAFATVNFGLAPPLARLEPYLLAGENMAAELARRRGARFLLLQTKARLLCASGEPAQAAALCRQLLESEGDANQPRMLSRTRCCLAEALRLSGETDEATRILIEAADTYEREELIGDLLDHATPLALKLMPGDEVQRAVSCLPEVLQEADNDLRRVRILCVAARRAGKKDLRDEVVALFQKVPALTACPVARRIEANWDEWITSDPASLTTDYWGVA